MCYAGCRFLCTACTYAEDMLYKPIKLYSCEPLLVWTVREMHASALSHCPCTGSLYNDTSLFSAGLQLLSVAAEGRLGISSGIVLCRRRAYGYCLVQLTLRISSNGRIASHALHFRVSSIFTSYGAFPRCPLLALRCEVSGRSPGFMVKMSRPDELEIRCVNCRAYFKPVSVEWMGPHRML